MFNAFTSAPSASSFAKSYTSPLNVIINPPNLQSGYPGDVLQLSVVVQNIGNQSAVIDVFLDTADVIPQQWCRAVRQRLALGCQQSSEVVFEFELPCNALPGTYDYTIVVDAPQHYPEETPLQYAQQLRVLLPAQTVVGTNDPTFCLHPATNAQHPVRLKPGEILPIEVRVENRSHLVDRFRLVSLDVEDDWVTIRYPTPSQNATRKVQEGASLELNPGEQGTIRLEVHPPLTTLAGIYSPTLRLDTDNQPDLVLLDLIYLEIVTIDTLNVELKTLLGRVRGEAISSQPTTTVNIKPRTLRIVTFSVNGQTGGGNVKLKSPFSLTFTEA